MKQKEFVEKQWNIIRELVKNSYRFPQVECMIESNEMYDYEQLIESFCGTILRIYRQYQ